MSWKQVKVGDVAQQVRGVTYTSGEAIDNFAEGYCALLRANNISDEGIDLNDVIYVPNSRVNAKQILKQNDILIAASSGSLSVVGKALTFEESGRYTFGAFCKVIRANENVHAKFLAHFFQTKGYREIVSSLAAGANINNLKNEHIDNLDLLLPPLEEQIKIATLLDQAIELEKSHNMAKKLLREFRESSWQEMVKIK